MSRIVPLPASNTVVDSTVAIINADGTVATLRAAVGQSERFTANGTFTVPDSVSSVLVTLVGGGAGGGGGHAGFYTERHDWFWRPGRRNRQQWHVWG